MGSTLPMCFATWTKCISWILTLPIVAETNAYRFWSNNNRSGIRVIGLKFETHPTHNVGGGRLLNIGFGAPYVFRNMH